MKQEVFVEGMKCEGCAKGVKEKFESIKGVESVSVDLKGKKATINTRSVIDKATFEKGLEFSAGIEYVLVNGNFILKNGKTVGNIFPGQAVYGKFKK